MNRSILIATLMLGTTLCSQSFGFDLLDRMLGLRGAGCDTACCETVACHADPACGVDLAGCCPADPACGIEAAGCCPTAGPACGADLGCCAPAHHRGGGLLPRLFGHLHGRSHCDAVGAGCCEVAAPCCPTEPVCGCETVGHGHGRGLGHHLGLGGPACGCETVAAGCDSHCGHHGRRPGLLSRLFGHHRASACDVGCDVAAGCGCGVSAGQIHGDAAPMPPAPVVDPSASRHTQRRVIPASSSYVR
jgi:hypothetical protein